MRTRKEIDAEIAKLKEIKPRVRVRSAFGENHHDAIDAQIAVLEELHDEDWCWDQQDPETSESGEAWKDSVIEAALDAVKWLNGTLKTLARDWEPLAR